jgi:uncharacterized membrane protein YphA (DoxX/SURF4 family)
MTTIRRADDVAATPGKVANIALWTLQVLVAMAFVAAGSGKLLGTAELPVRTFCTFPSELSSRRLGLSPPSPTR